MNFTAFQPPFTPASSPLATHTPYTPKGLNTPERVSTLEGSWQHAAPFGGDGIGDDVLRALVRSAFPIRSLTGPFLRLTHTGNSHPVSQTISVFPRAFGLDCCFCLLWSFAGERLATAMNGTDHTFSAASLRLRRALPEKGFIE